MNIRFFTGPIVLLLCALVPLSSISAQPVEPSPCPVTAPEGAAALHAAADACLRPRGPMLERNAAQALANAQAAMTEPLAPADRARTWEYQGEAHFWLGELGQAIATQTQGLPLGPAADRYWWRSVLMDRVDDTSGAIADAERAIALAPDRLDIRQWLGQYALDHDENDLALNVAKRAAATAPDDPNVLRLQGDALYALADYAAAKTAYERHMTLAPDPSPAVVARLAIIERRLGG